MTSYNARTTADEIIAGVDLTGKVAIVTGANTGIGFDTDLTVQFSEDVDCATITAGAATTTVDEVFSPAVAALRGAAGTTHTVVVDSCAGDTAVFAFDADFELASSVTVVLPGTMASARATARPRLLAS